MSQVDARVGIVTGDAPITLSSPDAALISTGSKEAGLWLWHGEAPPPPSRPQPKLRVRHILARMKPSARWAAWTALPGGLALTLLAVSAMYSAPPHRSESADAPAIALAPTASPAAAPPIAAVPPAPPTEAQFDQTRASPAPATSNDVARWWLLTGVLLGRGVRGSGVPISRRRTAVTRRDRASRLSGAALKTGSTPPSPVSARPHFPLRRPGPRAEREIATVKRRF